MWHLIVLHRFLLTHPGSDGYHHISVFIDSDIGLLLHGTEPSPEPVPTFLLIEQIHWKFSQTKDIFIQKDAFEVVVFKWRLFCLYLIVLKRNMNWNAN